MGLFDNPLGYAGYPADSTTATVKNSTVRAATVTEANTGTANNIYISPLTAQAAVALDFASPPVLGFGSTTPRPVAATTLTNSGATTLATGTGVLDVEIANGATTGNLNFSLVSGTGTAGNITCALFANPRIGALGFLNAAPAAARTTAMWGGNSAQNDAALLFNGNPSAGAQIFSVFGGAPSGGTQAVSFFNGNATGGAQTFTVLTGTRAGTASIGTGAAVHVLNMLASTGQLGFFGATAVVQQSQGALTNSVTAGGTTGTIANFTDLTVYANDSTAIRNDIYQLSLALSGVITALRNYGLAM